MSLSVPELNNLTRANVARNYVRLNKTFQCHDYCHYFRDAIPRCETRMGWTSDTIWYWFDFKWVWTQFPLSLKCTLTMFKATCIFQTDEPNQLYSNSIRGFQFHEGITAQTVTMTIVHKMSSPSGTINSTRRQNTVGLWQKASSLRSDRKTCTSLLWRCTRKISDCAS